jgi:hypothetical protein
MGSLVPCILIVKADEQYYNIQCLMLF